LTTTAGRLLFLGPAEGFPEASTLRVERSCDPCWAAAGARAPVPIVKARTAMTDNPRSNLRIVPFSCCRVVVSDRMSLH
jgi:hypothetical protein